MQTKGRTDKNERNMYLKHFILFHCRCFTSYPTPLQELTNVDGIKLQNNHSLSEPSPSSAM